MLKKYKKLWLSLSLAVTVVGLGAGVASANSNSNASASGQTNQTIYKAAANVDITGTVNGDVFCAGQTVNIDATVNGDILCAGQTINVDGQVNGNVRLVGQSVNVSANVKNNASVVGQSIDLLSSASVGGDTTLLGQTANVDSKTTRDLNATVKQLNVNSSIGRDLTAHDVNLNLGGTAKIGRNLSYTSPNTLTKASGAVVSGLITYHHSNSSHHSSWRPMTGFELFAILSLLVLALILFSILPGTVANWNKTAGRKVWMTALIGLVASIILPILIIALCITVVGVPLAILLALSSLAALILSGPLFAYYIGKLVLKKNNSNTLLVVLVGAVITGIIFLIPILGLIEALIAVWFAFGSILLNLARLYSKAKPKSE